jgi:hypothetical protein
LRAKFSREREGKNILLAKKTQTDTIFLKKKQNIHTFLAGKEPPYPLMPMVNSTKISAL